MEVLWIAVTVVVAAAALLSLGLRRPKVVLDDDGIAETDRAIDAKADVLDARLSALKATVESLSANSQGVSDELSPIKKAVVDRLASHLAQQKAARIEMAVWTDRAELRYGSGSMTTLVAHRDHVTKVEWGDASHVPVRAGSRAWEADAEGPTRAAEGRSRRSLLYVGLDLEAETQGTAERL